MQQSHVVNLLMASVGNKEEQQQQHRRTKKISRDLRRVLPPLPALVSNWWSVEFAIPYVSAYILVLVFFWCFHKLTIFCNSPQCFNIHMQAQGGLGWMLKTRVGWQLFSGGRHTEGVRPYLYQVRTIKAWPNSIFVTTSMWLRFMALGDFQRAAGDQTWIPGTWAS